MSQSSMTCTELTFNQTSYESGRSDVEREAQTRGEAAAEHFRRILVDVEFPGMEFSVGRDADRCFLRVCFRADDEQWTGRKWLLSPHMTKSEVVQTALKAVLAAIEHEAREHFLYRGRAIFGPHYDIDALHGIAGQTDVRTEPA